MSCAHIIITSHPYSCVIKGCTDCGHVVHSELRCFPMEIFIVQPWDVQLTFLLHSCTQLARLFKVPNMFYPQHIDVEKALY
jgi:hypothetical protein